MYYIEYPVVIRAFKKLINDRSTKIDNGIIGLLYLMKNSSSSKVSTLERVHFDEKQVSSDINHIFSFESKKSLSFNPETFFILSETYAEEIFKRLKNEKIDLLSIAIICFQTEEFENQLNENELIEYFIKKFNLPHTFIDTCFENDNKSLRLSYDTISLSDIDRKKGLETFFSNANNNPTIDFDGHFQKSPGGDFGRGAYTQKMRGTSALKDFLFVPNGLLQSALTTKGKPVKEEINAINLNVIYFGPSGTGKSTEARRELIEDKLVESKNISQITFHPEYTYSDFVGSLKPVTRYKTAEKISVMETQDVRSKLYSDLEPIIEFNYEPGPFVDICIKAANNKDTHYALIIDEINRGNIPEIMGDIFQLLDRESSNYSNSNSELLKYIRNHCNNDTFRNGLTIPSNLYLYATINPADQNVYPLDTAFKRRWKKRFLDINYEHKSCLNWEVLICDKTINWLDFIKVTNEFITNNLNLSEDKQLGQFFIKYSDKISIDEKREETLKVLSYLWEDIPKSKRYKIFNQDIFTFGKLNTILNLDKKLPALFSMDFSVKLESIVINDDSSTSE